MRGAIPLLPRMSSWCNALLSTGTTLLLPFLLSIPFDILPFTAGSIKWLYTKISCVFVIFLIRTTCPAGVILLYLIVVRIQSKYYKLFPFI